jgi:anti-sigma regulatory factor (Ser/Thr protein kinase)
MNAEAQCVLSARQPNLAAATRFVEDFGARVGLAGADIRRLCLIVEELFLNTAVHGARGGGDVQVGLTLSATPTAMRLGYEDSGPPFDPLAAASDAQVGLDTGPAGDRVGGLGLVLVTRMAEQVAYRREGNRNQLTLVVARKG